MLAAIATSTTTTTNGTTTDTVTFDEGVKPAEK